MAKRLPTVLAPKDSPIYTGKFVVSSMKYRRKENGKSNKANIRNIGRSSSEVRSRTDIDHSGKKSGKAELEEE